MKSQSLTVQNEQDEIVKQRIKALDMLETIKSMVIQPHVKYLKGRRCSYSPGSLVDRRSSLPSPEHHDCQISQRRKPARLITFDSVRQLLKYARDTWGAKYEEGKADTTWSSQLQTETERFATFYRKYRAARAYVTLVPATELCLFKLKLNTQYLDRFAGHEVSKFSNSTALLRRVPRSAAQTTRSTVWHDGSASSSAISTARITRWNGSTEPC